ncbi:MAG: hypothetical protein WC635_10155 [Bacteriovorax sp.]
MLLFIDDSLTNVRNKKNRLPLLGGIYCGQDLILELSECESRISIGIKILSRILPKYKFYTELLEQLFEAHRLLGIGIKKFIPEIRLALIRDLQFEKKIFDEILSGFLQFMVIAVTTWSFVILSKSLVQIRLTGTTVFIMLFLQISGAVLFFYLMAFLKNKVFFPFSKAIEELYLFISLMEVGLSVNEVLQRSGILQGSLATHKSFANLSVRLKKLISRMKETGLSPKDEAQEIIREIWHLQEVTFGKFARTLQILKFSILACFYLPAYFLFLYSIFKFFMEQ